MWACLLAKMVHFWKPWKHTFWPLHLGVGSPSVCSQDMPCKVLWSGMLEMGRGGQQQLRLPKAMIRQTIMPDELFNETQSIRLITREEGLQKNATVTA